MVGFGDLALLVVFFFVVFRLMLCADCSWFLDLFFCFLLSGGLYFLDDCCCWWCFFFLVGGCFADGCLVMGYIGNGCWSWLLMVVIGHGY